jgi:lysyl endopeptidase
MNKIPGRTPLCSFPKIFPLIFLALLVGILSATAQISVGGTPLSFSPAFEAGHGKQKLRTHNVGKLNRSRALAEEKRFQGSRFTAPQRVDLGLTNSGHWIELEEGGALWRLKLRSRDALALAILYDDFYLPPGATLFMYSEDRRQLLGAYTSRNNKPGGKFMTGLIQGETAILEYYEPAAVLGQGRLHIFRVDRAYRTDFEKASDYPFKVHGGSGAGFGASKDCHDNVNCPAGDEWQDEKRGISRIIVVVEEGMGFCTGNLLNNTKLDGRPYILSAFHCQDGFTPLYDFWRFDFNYESTGCENPVREPPFNSVLGCKRVAGRQENDLLLLEITTVIPSSYHVYYNGWDRRGIVPAGAVSIHHPVGDIKKIATINGGIKIFSGGINWDNDVRTPPKHHFDLTYSTGSFELGSSGSGLYNLDGLLVGHLHGGDPSCSETQAYYARFYNAWEGGGTADSRLKDWLDPLDAGTLLLPGTDEILAGFHTLSGVVQTEGGAPVAGVMVLLEGAVSRSAFTNESGRYTFENIPAGKIYGVSLSRPGNDINGLSTLDLIKVRKHILGIERLNSPYKMLAADVNVSNSITTLDIIKIQKVILGVRTAFEEVRSWQFLPETFTFTDPQDPFRETLPAIHNITDFRDDVTDFNFIGIKSGDVNGTANPGL